MNACWHLNVDCMLGVHGDCLLCGPRGWVLLQVQGALDRESDASRRSTRSSRRSSDLPGMPGRTVRRSSDPSSTS